MCAVSSRNNARLRASFVIGFTVAIVLFLAADGPEQVSSQARLTTKTTKVSKPARYSEFPHNIAAHRKDCASCHKFPSSNWQAVRPTTAAFPDITEYPEHSSCVGCHRQQFFKGARPAICSICHVNPSPRDSRRNPFPNPRETFDASPKGKTASSDFEISFPHAVHLGIVSFVRSDTATFFRSVSYKPYGHADESCAVCHKTLKPQGESADEYLTKPPADLGDAFWLKKGSFKGVPTGHTVCFSCHSLDSGMTPAPNSCGTCHVLGEKLPPGDFDPTLASRMGITERTFLDAWRGRGSAGAFRHEFSSHAETECSTCHNAEAINTLDPNTKRVSISSCMPCHVTATVEDGGALNYEVEQRRKTSAFQCTKCHIKFGTMQVPGSHINAIKEASGQ